MSSKISQNETLTDTSIDELVDIKDIKINTDLDPEERLRRFIEEIKNPYQFKCDGIMVESVFSDCNTTLTDRLMEYFRIME